MTQSNFKDETGKKYGKLTVIERAQNTLYGTAKWLCQCECGNTKVCKGSALRRGEITHCGCEKKKKGITNYFRIKSMSINEMADMLADIQNENDYFCCEIGCRSKHCMFSVCVEAVKQWLLQEVEE